MLDILKVSLNQGHQFVPDDRTATLKPPFRGFPILRSDKCTQCAVCVSLCPSKAITLEPSLSIDLGKCIQCGECERECSVHAIQFTQSHHLGADSREKLFVTAELNYENYKKRAFTARKNIHALFGRSLKLRSVSAAGCNACEMELNAADNVNFDMERFGIEIVASPRHADGIVITGPISDNMACALEDAFHCTPDPKIVIAMGSCAISGGIFHDSPAINRIFYQKHPVDIYIPGCPTHPLTFINAVLDFLNVK